MSGRQMSQTANFPGRQLSLQPNVQEPNVLGANCPERQLSGRQMSKAPNVGRQMSGRGLAGAICLPSGFLAVIQFDEGESKLRDLYHDMHNVQDHSFC